jgi:Lrp/AsnC family transcriptional regulator, leucine-responsive regulatory protein
MFDQTDWQILQCLQKDSRMQWQEIGKTVHLTGQAVAARIRRMQEVGIIEEFTVQLSYTKLGRPLLAFITVFMHTADHASFQRFLANKPDIVEAHRVSGEGCYWLKANIATQQELTELLDTILKYGNYRVNLSIGKIK